MDTSFSLPVFLPLLMSQLTPCPQRAQLPPRRNFFNQMGTLSLQMSSWGLGRRALRPRVDLAASRGCFVGGPSRGDDCLEGIGLGPGAL